MKLIAVTDIFGNTIEFQKLIEELSGCYNSVEIVDPYDGNDLQFPNEEEAYSYFTINLGLENYSEVLYNKIQDQENSNLTLLGFSVGASAIWAISTRLELFSKTRGICFYSSQVRNYIEVIPKIEIDLYFSEYEQTYDVGEIYKRLSCKSNVTCHRTSYLHGFMNIKSKNFNHEGYSRYIEMLKLT